MAASLAVLTAALTGWLCWPARSDLVRRQAAQSSGTVGGGSERDGTRRRPTSIGSIVEDDRLRTLVCLVACAVAGAAMWGSVGVVGGAVAGAVVSRTIGRLEPPGQARERQQTARDLPLFVDLVAACCGAGLPVESVIPQVARAVGGPIGSRFEAIRSRLELGAAPIEEWRRLGTDPQLHRVGDALSRAHRSGAPLVAVLTRLAQDVRRERRASALANARSVGVRVAAPLAACFLPAFMAVGVVPTIVGGFQHLGL